MSRAFLEGTRIVGEEAKENTSRGKREETKQHNRSSIYSPRLIHFDRASFTRKTNSPTFLPSVFDSLRAAAFEFSESAAEPRPPSRSWNFRYETEFSTTTMGKASSKPKLTQEDIDFLKRNTKFTEKEIRKWYKGFVRNCPKGHLTKSQFMEVYKNFFPSGAAERFCEHAFRTFDADNSGHVDFKEFLMAVNVTSSGTPRQKLEWAFRMYDIDGSGSIEEKEIVRILESIYEMLGPDATKVSAISPKARARMIFQKMDTNKDKELTLKEFIDGCLCDKELYQILTNNANQ